MNFKNISTLVVIMLLHYSTQAQIKKQFQDTTDALTTVVIKEDNASDLDILNDQFDLDEMGMHQVIRIKTENETLPIEPIPQVPEQLQIEEKAITAEVEIVEAPPALPVKPKPIIKEVGAAKRNNGEAMASKSYSSGQSGRTAFKPYYSKKRFKKKKRKKQRYNKMKRGKCYRF